MDVEIDRLRTKVRHLEERNATLRQWVVALDKRLAQLEATANPPTQIDDGEASVIASGGQRWSPAVIC